MTPVNPAIEGLRGDLDSRPPTPTVVGLEKDERDDFLRRENELSDSLAEKESALVAADKLVKELREELTFLKEQEALVSKVRFQSLFLVYLGCINFCFYPFYPFYPFHLLLRTF
jgi:hypothetical protein